MPDGAARLIGWRVTPGTGYGPGEPLAAVRAADDSVWDLIDDRPGTMAQTHPGPDTIVATSDLLAIARTASVIAGDLRGTPLRHSALPGGEFAAFSQDGMQLATMDTARILRIWDTETATELRRHEIKATLRRNGLDAARAPNGDWLVAYFDGSAVIVWNVTTGTQTARVSKGKDTQSVRFSADGRRLCTADLRHARIWEVTGQEVLSVKDRWQHTGCVAMRPDGQQLAVVAREGLEVWQQGGRKPTLVRALPRFKGKVWHLAFNADGEQVLFAYDTTMELAEVPSGTSLWTMADAVPITGAEFAAGGRLLATVNQPGGSLVTLRDPATGAEVGSLGKGDGAARFSADGRFLATAAADTSVVWALVR
jgi:WD40 repeat protein